MIKKAGRILFAVLAISIGLYPGLYFILDRAFGLLSTKSPELLSNTLWNIGFYTHIIPAGFALLIGWTQFSSNIRNTRPALHRSIGKFYVITVLLSATAGFGIAFFATGGVVTSLGFMCLAVIWFYTTFIAYKSIRKGQVEQHERMMIFSYAACFAAVTLRLWLPVLMSVFGDFTTAYTIVAWLCWIPNILTAAFITRRMAIGKTQSSLLGPNEM